MTELRNLINATKFKMKNNDQSIRKIKHPKLFINSLEELDGMIGMKKIKNDIALHTIQMIGNMNNGRKQTGMMNVVLTGSPGVGKTCTATIMAKIWYSLGYLNPKSDVKNDNASDSNFNNYLIIFMLYGFSLMITLFRGVFYLFQEKPYILLLLLILIPLLVVLIKVTVEDQKAKVIDDVSEGKINDRNVISVVSRKDFVAEYLGQTAPKTQALLEANRGKVLFIDEAYSLCQNSYMSGDPYGEIALNTLNQFLSENPDSIAVIFAGYENKMKESLFAKQPGLARRCLFHFEVDKYSGEDLVKIFQKQLLTENYTLENYEGTVDMFDKNLKIFKNYGGDTERLKSYVLMERNKHVFLSGKEIPDNIIREEDILRGLEKLGENDITRNDKKVNSGKKEKDERKNIIYN